MKKILLIICVVMFSSSITFGQDSKFDSRLLAKYSEKQLQKIDKENPSEIKFLTFCIENAQYVTVFPEGKEGAVEINGEMEVNDIDNINFYELNIELIQDNYQYYKIKNSDKLLIVKSKDHILKAMK